ncbi:MAG: methyltransferase, partial [Fuerstia sp.]|nr:methyltransferase [Fuerstiella sp.]
MPANSSATFERGSFRDRSGRVFHRHGQVFRALGHDGLQDWNVVSQKAFVQTAIQSGRIVQTKTVVDVVPPDSEFDCAAVLQHATIPVITWPYEWSFNMLRSAALLTLELLEHALAEDAILKDATPFNVQFAGSCPVFIDTSSIVPFAPGQIWDGYRQFCQMFLYPLMLQSWKNVGFQPWLRGSLEGISPQDFASLLS